MATVRPKVNFGDFSGLKEKGVSAQSLDKLKNAVKLGAKVTTRAELIKIGITADDATLIAANSSLSTQPAAQPVSVTFQVKPADLVGYTLGIQRPTLQADEVEEEVLPIPLSGAVRYEYDGATTGDPFTLFVKAPGGDFTAVTHDGATGTHVVIAKAVLGKHALMVTPVAELQNAKLQPPKPDPLLPPVRVAGRLISANPDVTTEKRQIFFEAATQDTPTDSDFFPIGYAETETNGYFFTSALIFPGQTDFKNLTAARATVAVGKGVQIPIRLDPTAQGKGKLPERLILYFQPDAAGNGDAGAAADCECEDCTDLNFHQKKVLDEFSYYTVVRTTEPLIETYEIGDVDEIELDELLDDLDEDVRGALSGLVVNRGVMTNFLARNKMITRANLPSLLDNIRADALRRKVLAPPALRRGRAQLDTRNAVDWDEKPTIYQAVSVAHGHLLHFKQEWFHDGYSLGDLLYSLPLAPGQKKQVVVFDWDRKESAANVQQLDYQESLYNSLSRDRDVNEVARAALSETIEGSSDASSWGVGGGLGVGAIIPIQVPIGALLGVGGGFGSGSSSARQSASRTSTASSQQQISDRTVQAANAVRSQRSTVVQTVSQGERFQVSAESVANYNHCHAMTIQYFEVLRHFEVRTRLAEVRECLFIPLKMSPFTPQKALRWRDILLRCLRKRSLAPGFDALYRIEEERESTSENYYDKIGLPRNRFAEEELEYIEGELYVEFQITRPRNDDLDEFVEANWNVWAPFIGNPREFYNRFLRAEQARDDAFARYAGPRIAEAIFDELRFSAVKNGQGTAARQLPIDATLMSDFRNRARLNVSLRMAAELVGLKREDIDFVRIRLDGATSQSALLRDLTNSGAVRITVHAGSMRYRTRNLHEYLFNANAIRNDLTLDGDDVRVFCPLSAKALRQPRHEDVEVSNELLHHLNENLEYYHQCLWSRMDAQRRFMLLDGIMAPGRANGRSVASVVENKLIGIVGNCLVMPVAPGFKLDPVLDRTVDLFEHYYEEPSDPMHLSLPTKGVFAEAVMGRCNSCEIKDEQRFWRWEESPIPDSPTAINAVTVPTPKPSDAPLTVNPFSQPIIALQNGPQLPDPQGFGALTSLLANPNLFRDLSGLSENQKNALAALQASLKTAEQFGEGAQALTGQAAELFKFNKLSEMLGKGQISKDEFKELVNRSQEAPDVSKLKSIDDAVKKNQLDAQSGERLKDATLKKIEQDADKGATSATDKPAIQNAIDSFVDADEGTLAIEENGSKVNVTKGGATGRGPQGTPTVLSEQEIKNLDTLNKNGVTLTERIVENGDDIIYEVFASRTPVSTDVDIEDTFVIVDFTLNVTDRDDGTDVSDPKTGKPLTLQLKAEKNVPPDGKKVLVGSKKLAKAVSKNRNLRMGSLSTTSFKGNPKAAITPANTLFLFPFPLSDGTSNVFEVGQPPAGAAGSSDNTTHVRADLQNKFAVDFTMPMSTEVFAMRDGVVVEVEESHPDLALDANGVSAPTDADKDKANTVRVRHSDGTYAVYVHLKQNAVDVAVGDAVTAGTTKLGVSGNSGFTTGPHLHVAVWKRTFDADTNTLAFASIPFKFKGPTSAGVTPAKGKKFKRTE